jgi:N-methylhydantoinase A
VVIDHVRTHVMPAHPVDAATLAGLDKIYRELATLAGEQVAAEGFPADRIRIERAVDVRFHHQAHELTVALGEAGAGSDQPVTEAALAAAGRAFRDLYAQLYGVRPDDALELVNYRVRAVGIVDKLDRTTTERAEGTVRPRSTRAVHFAETGGTVDTPVYRRAELLPGHRVEGPAMIEEPMSNIVVPPGHDAEVDDWRNVRVR